MKTLPVILAITAVILTGCVSTRTVDLSDDHAITEVNALTSRKQAKVTFGLSNNSVVLVDGRWANTKGLTTKARGLQVATDSISWMDAKTGRRQAFASNDIQAVRFRNTERGALRGLIVGGLIGAGLGAALSLVDITVTTRSCRAGTACTTSKNDHDLSFLQTAATTGLVTGLLGLVFGAMAGGQDVYHFESLPPPPGEPLTSATYYPPHRRAALVPHRKK